MASIKVSNVGSTSFSVQLTGLQTKDITYVRECRWNIRENTNNNTVDNFTEHIDPGNTEGDVHTITGLSSGATYGVTCMAYRINNDGTKTYLDDFSATVTTSGGGGSEGGGDETEITWSIYNAGSTSNFDGEKSVQLIFGKQYRICKYAISFANSGTATFYSEGSIDTYGYLTETSTNNITADGAPNTTILSEDDSGVGDGWNFHIEYPVQAGTTYYVWVREYYGEASGNTVLHIISPNASSELWTASITNLGRVNSENGAYSDVGIDEKTIRQYSVVFEESGEATIFVRFSSGCSPCLYLSTTNSYDKATGFPDDYIAEGSGASNVSGIVFNVQADRTYYIWVRDADGKAVDQPYLVVTLATSTSIPKWDWYSSNGNATDEQTDDARYAINNHGNTRNFSYKVWNDMVDKVKAIMDKAAGWWDIDYATYENTKMSGPEETLTAVMFNSLRNNIEIAGYQKLNLGYRTDIGVVKSYDDDTATESEYTVYGHYFTTLTDYMNECIDNL